MIQEKKILLLDDHSLFLKGMEHLLGEVLPGCSIYTYKSMAELMADQKNMASACLLISDIELPGEDVFNLFNHIKETHLNLPVLVISMHKKVAVIRKCKALGIEGYILKDEDELFQKAVSNLLKGDSFYSPRIESFFKDANRTMNKLSPREEDIIKLIAKGYVNKDIAEELFICTETVKSHKKNIKLKLGVDSTPDLILYAKTNFLM